MWKPFGPRTPNYRRVAGLILQTSLNTVVDCAGAAEKHFLLKPRIEPAIIETMAFLTALTLVELMGKVEVCSKEQYDFLQGEVIRELCELSASHLELSFFANMRIGERLPELTLSYYFGQLVRMGLDPEEFRRDLDYWNLPLPDSSGIEVSIAVFYLSFAELMNTKTIGKQTLERLAMGLFVDNLNNSFKTFIPAIQKYI